MDKYKAANGKYYTRQLFWEEWVELGETDKAIDPPFTLYKDKPNRINFGKEYVAREDPTGYKVAMEVLGDYRLWTVLMKSKWFQTAKKMWDEELEAKLASKAIEKIQELMEHGLPAQQLAAAKYLANKEYNRDSKATKGRPSNAQIAEAAREEAAIDKQLAADFERIRLVKN